MSWKERTLRFREIALVISEVSSALKKLQKKYPSLDAQPVLSSRFGQCELSDSPIVVLNSFPQIFLPDARLEEALRLLNSIKEITKPRKAKEDALIKAHVASLTVKLEGLARELHIDPGIEVNLRFGELPFELVEAIKNDPQIDPDRTPAHKASIKISLGTLHGLLTRHHGRVRKYAPSGRLVRFPGDKSDCSNQPPRGQG